MNERDVRYEIERIEHIRKQLALTRDMFHDNKELGIRLNYCIGDLYEICKRLRGDK